MQAKGTDGVDEPFDRIEDLAQFYLDAIKKLQPHGPYFLVGYSLGDQNPSPPDLCTDADLGNLPAGQLIGDGSQAAAFEFFDAGANATPLVADFDLRFEGANRALSTPVGQIGLNRDTLWWNGANCSTAGTFTCPK